MNQVQIEINHNATKDNYKTISRKFTNVVFLYRIKLKIDTENIFDVIIDSMYDDIKMFK